MSRRTTWSRRQAPALPALSALFSAACVLLGAAPAAADRYRDDQWHVPHLRVAQAHAAAPTMGEGVKVGVIDSGVDARHPDLSGNVLPGRDLEGRNDGRVDTDGHGTGMAGLIAAHGHGPGNADGALGLAPRAKIVPLKIPGNRDGSLDAPVAAAIDWLAGQGVKIISSSVELTALGSKAMERAKAAGILVVQAAGNSDRQSWTREDCLAASLCVGASGRDGQWHKITVAPGPFAPIHVLAPGEEIVSTGVVRTTSQYRRGTGSSPAAALASGLAALIWSTYPTLTADEVRWRILSTARDLGEPGVDRKTGHGVIDPVAALAPNVAPSGAGSTGPSAAPASASAAAPGPSKQPRIHLATAAVLGGTMLGLLGIGALVAVLLVRARRATHVATPPGPDRPSPPGRGDGPDWPSPPGRGDGFAGPSEVTGDGPSGVRPPPPG